MKELIESQQGLEIETPILATAIEMNENEIKQLMQLYRETHPEEFAGTPEWQIKVTAQNAAKVYDETGILFHISIG